VNELVVCSLECWDEVWRRNQFLVDGLLRRDPSLRVLFVEPPSDLLHGALHGRLPADPRVRRVRGRLWTVRPVKPLPRVTGPWADRALLAQVRRAVAALGFERPTLWINDSAYAPLAAETSWPTLYDVTDDWLLARAPERVLARRRLLERDLLARADEVVVCSPALTASRARTRPVRLIPNGVDIERYRASSARPRDLPDAPVAVYVGTLHEDRLDVELVAALARALHEVSVVLVGPDSLARRSRRMLRDAGVLLLGARSHEAVPAYLRHADVVLVPHVVSPFTESLDPIKAYECQAAGTPTVATRVAGFRDAGGCVASVPREEFVPQVGAALRGEQRVEPARLEGLSWRVRCEAFAAALAAASATRRAA
jgi:teichuronic acid biosynthesis glycosyltransferase TuaH